MARPTIYTEELGIEICADLAVGKSIRKACSPAGRPCVATFMNWLNAHTELLAQYTRAKEMAADVFFEDMLDIADNARKDKIPVYDIAEDGKKKIVGYKESKNSIRRAQVQIDVRKFYAMKLKPKRYGEKLAVEGDITNTVRRYEDLTDEQLVARAEQLLKEKLKKDKDARG